MKNLSKLICYWLVFILFAVSLVGCKVTVHKSLDSKLASHTYEDVRVISIIPKKKITIHFEEKQYTSAGGGLLWQGIDAGINKGRADMAEKIIIPLQEATANIDFRAQYWDEAEKSLAALHWLKIAQFDESTNGYTKQEMAEVESPFLILRTFYELSTNAQVLIVQTKANLYLNDLEKPDYFGYYTYYSDKIGKDNEKRDEAIELWTANDASLYLELIKEGIKENMYMLQLDLNDHSANPEVKSGEEFRIRIRSPISGSIQTLKGHLLKRTDDRAIIREKGGNLFSLDTDLRVD